MRTKFNVIIIMLAVLLMCSKFTFANGGETHDGFFLRLLFGGGYLSTTEKDILGSDLKLHGSAGYFSFQIGGAVTDNFILFFESAAAVAANPKVEWSTFTGSSSNTELQLVNFGGGFSYYFMPINIYLSLSIVAARTTLKVDTQSGSTEYGPGVNFSLGKEWWVSANWGLGIAFIGHYSRVKSDEGDLGKKDVINVYLGIAFSATYN